MMYWWLLILFTFSPFFEFFFFLFFESMFLHLIIVTHLAWMMIENGPAIACHYRIIVPPKERFAWSTSPFITPHAPSSLSPPTYKNTYDNATLLHLFLLFLAKHLNITRQLSQKRIRIANTGLRTFLNLRKLNHGKKKKKNDWALCCMLWRSIPHWQNMPYIRLLS